MTEKGADKERERGIYWKTIEINTNDMKDKEMCLQIAAILLFLHRVRGHISIPVAPIRA